MKFYLVLLLGIISISACNNSKTSSPQNEDSIQKEDTDFGELYQYYHTNPKTQEQKDENLLIDYVGDKNLDVFRTLSGVYIQKMKEFPEKDSIKWGDKISVHYKGYFLNGDEFDSSYKREKPITFRVGSMITGWNEALLHLKRGEEAKLLIPSHLAYGKRGFDDLVPPDESLIFDIEILEEE